MFQCPSLDSYSMKFILSCLLSFVVLNLPENAEAQALSVSATQLNFGTAYENAPDSLQLTIQNLLNRTVRVTAIRFYSTYGAPAFSCRTQSFSIAASASTVVWIKFSPQHNIYHNSELVIENDGLRGDVSVDLIGQGRYSKSYYNATENKEEELLKDAIQTLTGNGYVSLGYNTARDKMFMIIDNQAVNGQGASQNTLESIYTGQQAVGYVDRTDCQNRFNFNTEHTWPQSLFSSNEPMVSDLHHLFPTDDNSNGERGNNPFGVVNNPSWNIGGSKSDNSTFEPRDVQKGRTARAMMYFVLRYQNYSNFFTGQESILRSWHHTFPPTQQDIKRNDDIQAVQHNRNPFVDYPQFIDRITSLSSNSVTATVRTLDLPQDTILYGYISVGNPTVFHYVVVNTGNTDVALSNFNLDYPGELSFQSGGTNATLAPGEALGIDISCTPASSNPIHGHLTFSSNSTNHAAVTVPVYANDSVFTNVQDPSSLTTEIYPNPVQSVLTVQLNSGTKNYQIKLLDLTGRVLQSKVALNTQSIELDLSDLAPGNYILHIENKETGNAVYKYVVKY